MQCIHLPWTKTYDATCQATVGWVFGVWRSRQHLLKFPSIKLPYVARKAGPKNLWGVSSRVAVSWFCDTGDVDSHGFS